MSTDKAPNPLILAPIALITGLFLAVAALAVAALMSWPNPWIIALVGFSVVSALTWLILLGWWRRITEGVLGVDKGDDIVTLLEPVQAETVRVELSDNSGTWADWLDLPVSKEKMTAASVYLLGRNYETSNLGGAGKPLSRSQAESLRDYLIGRGCASWIRADAHTAGWVLGPSGRALVRRFARLGDGTTPKVQAVALANDLPITAQTHTNPQYQEGRRLLTD